MAQYLLTGCWGGKELDTRKKGLLMACVLRGRSHEPQS